MNKRIICKLTLRMSSFEAAVPKTNVAEPKTITVAAANAFPTADTRNSKGGLRIRQKAHLCPTISRSLLTDWFCIYIHLKHHLWNNIL